MSRFEKPSAKRATFLKSAEQLVEEREDYVPPDTPMDRDVQRMEADMEHQRRVMEGEYRARNRARTLLSMEVTRAASPSERLKIVLPDGCPFGLRWCDDEYRDKMGMDIWSAVTPEEFDDLKRFVNTDQVKVKDGRVMAGGLFLAKAPREKIEKNTALYFQRSQRSLSRASAGRASLMNRVGSGEDRRAVPAGASMGDIEDRAGFGRDEPLIRFKGQLRDDSLAGYEP